MQFFLACGSVVSVVRHGDTPDDGWQEEVGPQGEQDARYEERTEDVHQTWPGERVTEQRDAAYTVQKEETAAGEFTERCQWVTVKEHARRGHGEEHVGQVTHHRHWAHPLSIETPKNQFDQDQML